MVLLTTAHITGGLSAKSVGMKSAINDGVVGVTPHGGGWLFAGGGTDEAGGAGRAERADLSAAGRDGDEGDPAVRDEELASQHDDRRRHAVRQDGHLARPRSHALQALQGHRVRLCRRQGSPPAFIFAKCWKQNKHL